MARAIDADKAIEVAQIKYNDWNLAMAAADGQREINLCFKKQELFKAVKAVLECVPTLTPPNEWVAVEERLPEYNPGTGAKSYWVAKKDNAGNWQMKIAQYCDYGYAMTMDAETEVTWRDWDFTKIANVTHWMLLPAPPTKEE